VPSHVGGIDQLDTSL